MSSTSWKQYGGINYLDNTKLGTIIADNLILKNAYNGDFTVNGNLHVGNITAYSLTISNLSIDNNVLINGNLTTQQTAIFNGNVILNGNTLVSGSITFTGSLNTTSDLGVGGNIIVGKKGLEIEEVTRMHE